MNTTLKEKWLYFLPSWRVKEKKSLPSIFFPVITPHIAVLQRGVKYPVLIAFFFLQDRYSVNDIQAAYSFHGAFGIK